MKTDLKRELNLVIQDNTYQLKFPSVGQLLSIEEMKSNFGLQSYNLTTSSGSIAYTTGEMVATFTVLVPELKKDLNIDSYSNMNMIDSKVLLDAYVNQFLPWFQGWLKEINKTEK